MKIKLIAMDLDGIALQTDRCSLSPRLNTALDMAFEKRVAMGNAPDFVKASANAVTDTNANDGAAAAIEHFVLQNI